jgi:hypothetical protein
MLAWHSPLHVPEKYLHQRSNGRIEAAIAIPMAMLKARVVRVLPSTDCTAAPRLSQTNPLGKAAAKNSAAKVSL